MNPETVLNLFEALMSQRKPSISGKWAIVNRNGVFLCRTVETLEPNEYTYGRYNDDDLTMGLSIKQWNKLKYSVAQFYEGEGAHKCHSKP